MDVWPVGRTTGALNPQHRTMADRLGCAKSFVNGWIYGATEKCREEKSTNSTKEALNSGLIHPNPTFLLDNSHNDFERIMQCWPLRMFLVANGASPKALCVCQTKQDGGRLGTDLEGFYGQCGKVIGDWVWKRERETGWC